MNKSDFLDMIGDTAALNRQLVGEVSELVNIFPYFQSAHLLLLKGLHNIADIKFENQLRHSAIHIADREVLYYLLNSPHANDKVQNEELKIVSSAGISIQNPEVPENSNQAVPEPENVYIEAAKEENPSVISVESAGIENPEVTPAEIMKTEGEIDIKGNIEGSESVPFTDDLLELDQDETEAGDADAEAEQYNREVERPGRQLQSELIDKFIIANPRIEPNRDKTPLSPQEVTKHMQEEGVFVTETLARIYVNQGYYSKAIDIYEKLSLKFPEKSSYFASQIEKVKEHLKN